MMSSKLQASRRCRTQERSVFLGATLSRSLHESRESEAVGYTKPSGLKNPRFSKSGSSQLFFFFCFRLIRRTGVLISFLTNFMYCVHPSFSDVMSCLLIFFNCFLLVLPFIMSHSGRSL